MTAIAVIVGVDAYAQQPLTSAFHDAMAFRDELISLGLASDSEVRLLTAPVVEKSALAVSRNIDRALHDVYDDGVAADRLFVYFAGHGLLAPTDAARGIFQTAFVPVDVADLRNDSRLLFNVDERTEAGKPGEVGLPGVVGPAPPLVEGQDAVRVDRALERVVERLARVLGRLARVMDRVHPVGPDTPEQPPVVVVAALARHLLSGPR